MRRNWLLPLIALVAMLGTTASVPAADHVDGPAAAADPAADITDVFAWISPDTRSMHLVMDLVRNASTSSRFSDRVQYVFHTDSVAKYGDPVSSEVDIICQFDSAQKIQCWAGTEEYVTGDASQTDGIRSANGRLRVFAGLRNDPFFFNLTGFKETAKIVEGAAASLQFDAAGCPKLDAATVNVLGTQLRTGKGGAAVKNDFAGFNVLAIVVAIDKTIVTKGGPIVGVWASTNRR